MRICAKCVLPETFPGVQFDERGICNFCTIQEEEVDLDKKKKELEKKFEKLLKDNRGKSSYDALVSYSGGKDSTYTLIILKEDYGLKLLAFTVDNGFLPEQTYRNIRNITEKLGVDHVFLKPSFPMLRKIFRECSSENIYSPAAMKRASAICTSCMAIVRFSALRCALEKKIPFLVFGWSPGQLPVSASILRNNPSMVRTMQKAMLEPLLSIAGPEIKAFFLEDSHFEDSSIFPYNVSPLAFLGYDEEKIKGRVSRFGWVSPAGVDVNSTNCLLNSYANIVHKKFYGFNPYVFELAKLVREGYLDRPEALRKLDQPEDPQTVELVEKKLFG